MFAPYSVCELPAPACLSRVLLKLLDKAPVGEFHAFSFDKYENPANPVILGSPAFIDCPIQVMSDKPCTKRVIFGKRIVLFVSSITNLPQLPYKETSFSKVALSQVATLPSYTFCFKNVANSA